MVLVSLRSAANSALLRAYGGGKRNCEGRVKTHGVIVANWGPAPNAFAGGVGLQYPTAAGVPTMPSTPSNGGGVGAFPSVNLHAQIASATVCPHKTPSTIDCALSVRAASEAFRWIVSAVFCAGYTSRRIA